MDDLRYDFPKFPTFGDFFSNFWSGNDFMDEVAEASFHNHEHRYGNEFPNGGRRRETLETVKCTGRKCKHRSVSFPGVIHSENRDPLEDDGISFPSFFSRKWKPNHKYNGYQTFDYWKSGSEQKKVWKKQTDSFGGKNYVKATKSRRYESVKSSNNEQPIVSGIKSGSKFLAFGLRKKSRDVRAKTSSYNKRRPKNRDSEGREDKSPSTQKEIYFKPTVNIQLVKENEKQKVEEFEPEFVRKPSCFDSEECEGSQAPGNGSQYYRRNQEGQGSYRFGYRQPQSSDLHYRKEKRDSDGQVTGRYGYRLPDGQRREVRYWIDKIGGYHQKTHIL